MKGNVFQYHGDLSNNNNTLRQWKYCRVTKTTNMGFPKDVASSFKKYELDLILEQKDLTNKEENSDKKKLI